MKLRSSVFCILLSFISIQGFSQFTVDWQRCYGGDSSENIQAICATSDGGYAFLGYTNSTNGDPASLGNTGNWLVKIDSTGNIQWQKIVNNLGANYEVFQQKNGNLLIPGSNALQCFTSSGNQLWTDSNFKAVWGIAEYPDSTLLISSKSNILEMQMPAVISKVKQNVSSMIWQKRYYHLDNVVIKKILITPQGFSCGGYGIMDSYGSFPMFMKMNDTGKLLYSTDVGTTLATQQNQAINDIVYLPTTNRYAALIQNNLRFFDDTCHVYWTRSDVAPGLCIVSDRDTALHILGFSGTDYVKYRIGLTNLSGKETMTMGGSNVDVSSCMIATKDSGLIIAGYTKSNDGMVTGNHGGMDGWVVKLKRVTPPATSLHPEPILASVKIYPTLTEGIVHITSLPENKALEVQVLDITGRSVYNQQSNTGSNVNLDLSGRPAGVYMVRLQAEGQIHTQKIVLQY